MRSPLDQSLQFNKNPGITKMVLSMERWVGKVAVVTGAAHGLGAAIASRLVQEGLIVAGLDLDSEPIKERAKQLSTEKGRLYAFKTDITKEEEVQEAFKKISEQLGPVHILCNNAVYGLYGPILETSVKDCQKVFDTNVVGLCIVTKEAVTIMRANNIKGHIININDIQGHRVTKITANVYPASKFAVTALNETLRQEMVALGTKIKVTSISPSLVEGELTTWYKTLSPEAKMMVEERPKLMPEALTDAILYVLSTPEHVQVHELTLQHVDWKYSY